MNVWLPGIWRRGYFADGVWVGSDGAEVPVAPFLRSSRAAIRAMIGDVARPVADRIAARSKIGAAKRPAGAGAAER